MGNKTHGISLLSDPQFLSMYELVPLSLSPSEAALLTLLTYQSCAEAAQTTYLYTGPVYPPCMHGLFYYTDVILPLRRVGLPLCSDPVLHLLLMHESSVYTWNVTWYSDYGYFISVINHHVWLLLSLILYVLLRTPREELLVWLLFTTCVIIGAYGWSFVGCILLELLSVISLTPLDRSLVAVILRLILFVRLVWFFRKQAVVTYSVAFLLEVLVALHYL